MGRRFYALVNRLVLSPVLRAAGVQTSAVRVELVGAQLVGLAMMRYVLKVEPIASLDVDELVPMMAPALRQTLTGRDQACSGPGRLRVPVAGAEQRPLVTAGCPAAGGCGLPFDAS